MLLMLMGLHDEKIHISTHFNHFHLMVPSTMPSASYVPYAIGLIWWKCHIVPYFSHHNLSYSVVPFMMLSVLHDAGTNTSAITWWKKSCFTLFQRSWPKEFSGTTYDAIGIMWYWHQRHHMMKKSCCTSFQLYWPVELNDVLNNAI